LRSSLEDREQCELLRNKWRTFKTFLPKVKDADDRLVKRTKMFTPGTGQNRCNAVERVSKEAEKNGKMDHDFLALAPRTVTKYLSFENQGRDSCKQTILPSERFCSNFVSQGTSSLVGMQNIFDGFVCLTQNKSGKCA